MVFEYLQQFQLPLIFAIYCASRIFTNQIETYQCKDTEIETYKSIKYYKENRHPPQIVLVNQMQEFSPTTISDIAIESFWGRKFVITKFNEMPLFTRRQLEKMKDAK